MSKKVFPLIAVVVLMGLLLSACQLRASTPPVPTPTDAADFPFPVGEGQSQDIINDILTQTASVGGGAPESVVVQETPEPAADTPQEPQAGEDDQAGGGIVAQPEVAADTPVPVAVPTVTRPTTYTIQKGEWPICIARRYDLPMGALLSSNNLSMQSQVSVGTTLQIPQSGNWNAANGSRSLKAHPTTYSVQSGDTVNSIACAYGDVTPEAIIAVNGLQSPYTLTAGQTLQIP
jgi:LysM repeat protein